MRFFESLMADEIAKGAFYDIGPPMTYAQMKIRTLERSAKMAAPPGEIFAFTPPYSFIYKCTNEIIEHILIYRGDLGVAERTHQTSAQGGFRFAAPTLRFKHFRIHFREKTSKFPLLFSAGGEICVQELWQPCPEGLTCDPRFCKSGRLFSGNKLPRCQ